MKIVTITVQGGFVENVEVPKGVRVIVRDYDDEVTPEDELEKDENGALFIECLWDHE